MSKLQEYFWKQAFWPLIITLLGLAALALLTQSLTTLDLIVENRQSALTFFYITILALPQLMSIILPLAVFMAVIYAVNRLNVDSEMSVAKAVGTSPWQISTPFVRLACLAVIGHLLLNLWIQPSSFRTMRVELLKVKTDLASQMVRPGEFVTPTSGLTVYAREILPNGRMEDVIIRDARVEPVSTYTAKAGIITKSRDSARLTLQEGMIQQLENDGTFTPITFEKYQIDLSEIVAMDRNFRLKTSDRYLHELFYPSAVDRANPDFYPSLIAEGHARLATPLYNIALTLLALAFLVRGQFQKLGYGRRIALLAVIGFGLRLVGFALISASEGNMALNPLQYAVPIVVSLACLWYLLSRSKAGNLWRMIFPRRQASAA
ncbi:MAG: LptF/LptG family permease [Hellea sp.]|nr:LptF/LptG family permease [Hellea sp.]